MATKIQARRKSVGTAKGGKRRKPATSEPKEWTVLVYMAGDNNLESFGRVDIGELKKVGSGAALDIAVQLDTLHSNKTRRYHLRKGTSIDADVVQTLGEVDTGDPKVASDFFHWGIKTYPAKRYLAVFWNHGSGIDETDIYADERDRGHKIERRGSGKSIPYSRVRVAASRPVRRSLFSTTRAAILGRNTRAIAYDDSARDFLDNVEFGRVVAEIAKAAKGKVAVLGLDACLMNMVEVAYQVRANAQVLVGSQEVEPGDGWPYDRVVAAIAKKPTLSTQELGAVIVREYANSYNADTVTQSALDLGKAEALARHIDELAGALLDAIGDRLELSAIRGAATRVQRFDTKDFVDLVDFCELLKAESASPAVQKAAGNVIDAATQNGIVIAAKTKGAGVRRAHGLSIYFPSVTPDTTLDYARLDFAKWTRWGRFLDAYHES